MSVAVEEFRTRPPRVADGDGFEVRHGLRALKYGDLEPRRVHLYPVTSTRRPTNVLVRIEAGSGSNPTTLQRALRLLKRGMQDEGVNAAITRHEEYTKPSERRRMKRIRARRRAAKVVRLEQRREARAEARGL